jgi:hypothetical protein
VDRSNDGRFVYVKWVSHGERRVFAEISVPVSLPGLPSRGNLTPACLGELLEFWYLAYQQARGQERR